MIIKDLASKKAVSAGLTTLTVDETISITVWPDIDLQVVAGSCTHLMGGCRAHIHISVRHDGTPEQIELAIRRAIATLNNAK
jgi:hypothetical protein